MREEPARESLYEMKRRVRERVVGLREEEEAIWTAAEPGAGGGPANGRHAGVCLAAPAALAWPSGAGTRNLGRKSKCASARILPSDGAPAADGVGARGRMPESVSGAKVWLKGRLGAEDAP